jgi:pimeloyl-ACP methyl ester carboxylesterase
MNFNLPNTSKPFPMATFLPYFKRIHYLFKSVSYTNALIRNRTKLAMPLALLASQVLLQIMQPSSFAQNKQSTAETLTAAAVPIVATSVATSVASSLANTGSINRHDFSHSNQISLSASNPSTSKPEQLANTMPNIKPFTIHVSDSALEDLAERLVRTRLPDQLDNASWEYGTDLAYLTELVTYWREEFDWRKQEAELNQFDQFTTEVDDLTTHFIHQRSSNEDAMPLLLVHGWPGSISEFSKIIGPLTNPQQHGLDPLDSFHVIAPSLPGFGFSAIPSASGYSPEKMAHIFAQLMAQLGYEKFAIAGGDWGAIINRHMANTFPDKLIALHSNMLLAAPPADSTAKSAVTEAEASLRDNRLAYMRNEVGYQQIQGTKPQSLGYGLNDSPAGLAAWIVEKFHGWTDLPQGADGDLNSRLSKDEILTNISIYWHTQTITSSTRIYYENRRAPRLKEMEYINVPTGVAIFPADIYITPKSWAQASYDIRHWTVMPKGGHFAALEEPQLYLEDLQKFFRLFR